MPVSQGDALKIHAAIHGGKDSVKLLSGQTLPVTKNSGKLRCVKDDATQLNACEQNQAKASKFADMAKAGSKITWFLGGHFGTWGRVVDGVVEQCGARIEKEDGGKAKGAPPPKAKGMAAPAKAKAKAATPEAAPPPPKASGKAKAPAPAEAPPAKKAKSEAVEKAPAVKAAEPAPAAPMASGADPLALGPLFAGKGHGATWEPLLRPVIEKLPDAATYIGPSRSKRIVPVRELTFQALKPNPPSGWRVVSLGQSPYPRVESATGIAHFDGNIGSWDDSRFGSVVTMRCIIKAAAMNKYDIPKKTSTADLRKLLKEKSVVGPAEWFQAMLAQGVLFMNAACTLLPSEDKSVRAGEVVEEHRKFWQPVFETILDSILVECKKAGKGIVFAWWGAESLKSKKVLQKTCFSRFPDVKIEHIEHKNPAAMGDAFCDNDIFGTINGALAKLKLGEAIDWLPSTGWQARLGGEALAGEMGDFIAETQELHKMYLERLKDGLDDRRDELADITGIEAKPLVTLDASCKVLSLAKAAEASVAKAKKTKLGALSVEEGAAIHMYTTNHLYKSLNAALRSATRDSIVQYFLYLRLFLVALCKLPVSTKELYRGVSLDLSAQYLAGSEVTWWAVSSCTPDRKVASSFSGGKNAKSTLFVIKPLRSVGIREFSEYKAEEEFILAPGTQFLVEKVSKPGVKVEIHLKEVDRPRRVR